MKKLILISMFTMLIPSQTFASEKNAIDIPTKEKIRQHELHLKTLLINVINERTISFLCDLRYIIENTIKKNNNESKKKYLIALALIEKTINKIGTKELLNAQFLQYIDTLRIYHIEALNKNFATEDDYRAYLKAFQDLPVEIIINFLKDEDNFTINLIRLHTIKDVTFMKYILTQYDFCYSKL